MSRGETYEEFVGKFEPKRTTDDCYTPDPLYDAVAGWVEAEYGVPRERFVRPFWPGGDFEAFVYPEGCAVVDNPPFSIMSRIRTFYRERGVPYFLFAQTMTAIGDGGDCTVCVGYQVTYENGAKVNTSFVTNMEPGTRLRTAPGLYALSREEEERRLSEGEATLPKYEYPDEVVTASIAARWCKYGVEYSVSRADSVRVPALDQQRVRGISSYGSALLLSARAAAERAAAERAAAERAAAERWQLSPRERRISEGLGVA